MKIKNLSKVAIICTFSLGLTSPMVFASTSIQSLRPIDGGTPVIPPTPWSSTQIQQYTDFLNTHTTFHGKTGDIKASTASNSQLQEYGIPVRPTNPVQLQKWNQTFGTIKRVIRPQFKVTNITNQNWGSYEIFGNWCGGINQDSSLSTTSYNTTGYQDLEAYVTVPNLAQYTQQNGTISLATQWVGLGGNTSNLDVSLEQDGIAEQSNGSAGYTYYPWWEDYSNVPNSTYYHAPMVQITNMNINPGDSILLDTELINNGTEMQFFVDDLSNGTFSGFFDEPTDGDVSNNCAEWISEDPGNGAGGLYSLANYGICNFTNASFSYGTESSYNTVPPTDLPTSTSSDFGINTVDNGTTLQTVSSLTGSDNAFTTTWDNY
jgi:hypothetical protein